VTSQSLSFNLKRKLLKKELCIGSWCTLYNPAIVEILANSGYEFIVIDLEHTAISIHQAVESVRVLDLMNVSPLVRVTSLDVGQIKRVIDSGAHGIIVPSVESSEDVRKVVEAIQYPPIGTRGAGLGRAQKYGEGFDSYYQSSNENIIFIPQIETKKGVDNIEEILLCDQVDGILVGPYDLSSSLGIAGIFDHPMYNKALEIIVNAVSLANKSIGIHVVDPDPDLAKKYIKDGFNFIVYGTDIRFLSMSAKEWRLIQ
jgi:2-keto-3-deoxy-L-rhamnonate aldolase RhmA